MKRKMKRTRKVREQIEKTIVMRPNFSAEDAYNSARLEMPTEMGDWLKEQIDNFDAKRISCKGRTGYAMRSIDCTIVFFPSWNCAEQFASIVNQFEVD